MLKNFKRTERFKYNGKVVEMEIDKNDSVYRCYFCEVLSWKNIVKGSRKISVPDEIKKVFDSKLFEKIKGNPYKIAVDRIMTYIERM